MAEDPMIEFARLIAVLRGLGWDVRETTVEATELRMVVTRPRPPQATPTR